MVGAGSPRSVQRVAFVVAMGLLAAVTIGGTMMVLWPNYFSHDSINSAVPLETRQESPPPAVANDPFAAERQEMVERQLRGSDITDRQVLDVMGRVPRERFVPVESRPQAYEDHPLPIGHNQTISQPYIVALMTQLARPTANSRALEVGAGSGYQAAILAELCKEVYAIEILKPLADSARSGSLGWATRTSRSVVAMATRVGPNMRRST